MEASSSSDSCGAGPRRPNIMLSLGEGEGRVAACLRDVHVWDKKLDVEELTNACRFGVEVPPEGWQTKIGGSEVELSLSLSLILSLVLASITTLSCVKPGILRGKFMFTHIDSAAPQHKTRSVSQGTREERSHRPPMRGNPFWVVWHAPPALPAGSSVSAVFQAHKSEPHAARSRSLHSQLLCGKSHLTEPAVHQQGEGKGA